MEGTVLSLLAPVLTVVLILTTKRLIASLTVGILLGSPVYRQWNIGDSMADIFTFAGSVFIGEGKVLAFVLLVGSLASLLYLSGSIYAFSEWGVKRAKTRFQAQLATMVLGLFTWFDDSFSCLFRGTVMRSITDRYRISHSKLAYQVHSTSAPIAMMVPVAILAVVLISLLGSVLESNGITTHSAMEAYLLAMPGNYYIIVTLVLVVVAAFFNINLGQMRRDEQRAVNEGVLFDTSRGKVAGDIEAETTHDRDGKVIDLVLPVLTLLLVTVGTALVQILGSLEGEISATTILAGADTITALVYGGLAANFVAVIGLVMAKTSGRRITGSFLSGLKTTLPSVVILFMALVTAQVIGQLGVGDYLASLIKGNVSMMWLPAIFFIAAAFMSYSIGSTLGTASLMVPIGVELVIAIDPAFLIPVISASLAGTVFGEHSSPLSDTTILASIGSAVHPIDHIITQFPYAIISSVSSVAGFIVLGLTHNTLAGLGVALGVMAVIAFALKARHARGAAGPEAGRAQTPERRVSHSGPKDPAVEM